MLQANMIHDTIGSSCSMAHANDVLPQEVPYNWLWTKIGDDQVELVFVKGVTL